MDLFVVGVSAGGSERSERRKMMRGVPGLAAWVLSASAGWSQITPFLVDSFGGPQLDPRVSGTVVVWNQFLNGDFTVRGKDLASGTSFLIIAFRKSKGRILPIHDA